MKFAQSAAFASGVLALTIGCASANRSTPEQPQAPSTTAAAGVSNPKPGLERYVGVYDFEQFKAAIILRRGSLVRQVEGQQDHILTPIGSAGNRFQMGSTPAEMQFVIDKSGAVTEVIEGVGGHIKRGVRLRQS